MNATTSAPGDGLSLVGRCTEDGTPVRVTVEGGLVTSIERVTADPGGTWISPGWMDIQVNGYAGHDPNAADADASTTAAMVRSSKVSPSVESPAPSIAASIMPARPLRIPSRI